MRFRSSSRCSRNDILPAGGFVVVVGRKRARRPDWGPGKGNEGHDARAYAPVGRCDGDWLVARRRSSARGRRRPAGGSAGLRLLRRRAAALRGGFPLRACSSSSFEARLNSARLLPSDRPSSGSLRGPKMIRAITKMMISSGMPIEPNIGAPTFRNRGGTAAVIIGTGLRQGQGNSGRRDAQKSLPVRKLSARMPIMRRYRPLPAVVFAIARVRARRRVLRTQRARDRRQGSRALQDVHRRAERDRGELRRQGRVRQPRLQRDPRHARHARSAFELLRPEEYAQMRERQEGRYYGLGISDSGDRRRHHRDAACSKARRRTRRASAAATSSRKIAGEDAKGWTTEQAMQQAARPEGHARSTIEIKRRGYDELIPIRADARRGLHPDRAGVLHDRRDDRLHPACRTSARTPIAT